MALLKDIAKFNKESLQHVATRVTASGFVVDTKPDLAVAMLSPNVFLGSQDAAHTAHVLQTHAISYIISVRLLFPCASVIVWTARAQARDLTSC